MALVQYGAGVVSMSGSIAGNVHARNRFGNYIRPRTKPVNPHSPRQEAARAIISYLAEMWHSDLNAVQRGLWDTYAAAVAMNNRIGQTVHLTGFNHFIRSNAAMMTLGGRVKADAPTTLSLPEKDTDLACSEEDIAGQTFTFTCNIDGWDPAPGGKYYILIYQGRPQLASRSFFGGPWRYMGYIDNDAGPLGTKTLDAVFSFALSQKVWFRARVITRQYRLSEPWNLDPRTIVANPA